MPTIRDMLVAKGVPLKGYQAPGLAPGEPTPGEFQDWFSQQGSPGGAAPPGAPGAPGAPPAAGAPPGGSSSEELLQYFDSLRQGLPPNSASLLSLEPQLQAKGIKVLRNAMGIAGKIQLPSGEIVDVGGAFSSGNQGQMSWQTLRNDPKFGGGAGGSAQSLAELQNSPGFQFRLAEGAKALERSAAARGTLLTGGTLKGLQRYAQDYASGEYQNRYNQLLGLTNVGAASTAAQAGQASQYGQSASNLLTQQGNAQSAGTIGSQNAYNNAITQGTKTAAEMYYLSRLYGGGGGGGAGYVQDDVNTVAGRINNSNR